MQITEVLTASKILLKTLSKLGVDTIFGYPGSTVLPIYDELSKQDEIKHILLRHEQNAVHAAEGYARVSGKCGVILVTAGPGASNTITGIANAYLDGFPLVVISGQVSTDLTGKDAFQEINFTDIVKTCTKAAFKVLDIEELESTLLQAYLIAMSGKKGPVVVDIPKDILELNTEYKNLSLPSDKISAVSKFDVIHTIELLSSAKSPLVVCGGGVLHSGACENLLKFIDKTGMPVVSTMMGLGTFPANHPNFAGMIGLYGNTEANELLQNSDTLLVLGARFNDRVTAAFSQEDLNRKTIIQVDINSKELIRNISSDLAVNSDIKDFLKAIIEELPATSLFDIKIPKVQNKVKVCEKLSVEKIIKTLYTYTKHLLPVIATEVGQHQIALVKNYKFDEPRKLLVSGGLGTMGFGLGAAIGASIALGKSPIILVSGDGSFQMNSSELAVCAEFGIPVKVLILNNGYLGMVKQLQDEQCEGRNYQTALSNPDFVMLAKSYGIEAMRVEKEDEIIPAFDRAFEALEPFVIEFVTDENETV